jgi:hypothetical protein
MQDPQPRIGVASVAPAGGTLTIKLNNPGDSEVIIRMGASIQKYKVGKDRKVTVPVPNLPGEYLIVTVVHGMDVTAVPVLIIAPSP